MAYDSNCERSFLMAIMLTDEQTAVVRRLAASGHFASEQEALDASLRIAAEHLAAMQLHDLAAEGRRSGDPIEWSPALLQEIKLLSVRDFEEEAEIKDDVKP
jgi:Arc/MetJ-type ribon-helix-helix transcriptional regulator